MWVLSRAISVLVMTRRRLVMTQESFESADGNVRNEDLSKKIMNEIS